MKVMVLGGGGCQINLIERLKSQGDEVVLIDYLPDCLGSDLCDVHIKESTFDTPAVLKAAKKHSINSIVTLGTDQPVYTAAKVATDMGLPFYVTPDQALSATNKRVMKEKFLRNDIPTVNYRLISKDFSDKDIEGISFPAVLKPVDSQGQRGIYKINSIAEIKGYIEDTLSYSREEQVLLEEYYESDEITINGWLKNGKLTLLSVVDRVTLTSGDHIGICIAHNFPSLHLKDNYNEIEELTQRIVDVFGFMEGPVYFQYLIGNEGIKVNEIAMRIGGAYEDITLPIITGIDVLGMLINSIKGYDTDSGALRGYSLKDNDKYISTQMFFLNPGKITSISYDKNRLKACGVDKVVIARKTGDVSGSIENATARAGYFIVQGESYNKMYDNIEHAYDEIKILDRHGRNMVKRYSLYEGKYKFASEDLN
jgi:biotin carboxylase